MTYTKERDEFIAAATREGLDLDTCIKLLRYASTLQRLAEARCNGDWPYNGDRDRPAQKAKDAISITWRGQWDQRYTTCPKCEASGVAKVAMRTSADLPQWVNHVDPDDHKPATGQKVKICPDCRTQELVSSLLQANDPGCGGGTYKPIFQGDPRGAVLRLATPKHPYAENGANGARGLYVPAR